MNTLPNLSFSKLVILAGAGISIPSGVASGQMFNRLLIPHLLPDGMGADSVMKPLLAPRADRADPRKDSLRFEQLVQILRDAVDPSLHIMDYLELSWSPSSLHYWLAEAIQQGAIVLTTNPDSLIEVAYRECYGAALTQILDPADYRSYSSTPGAKPALFKLHGSLRRSEYLGQRFSSAQADASPGAGERAIETFGVTLDQVGRLDVTAQGAAGEFLLPDHILDTLHQILPGRDVLVIGYSGSDDFDIKPSFRRLNQLYQRVVWIDHRELDAARIKTRGRLTLVRGRTKQALEAMFPLAMKAGAASAMDAQAAFQSFCAQWAESVGLYDTKKYLVCGQMLKHMGYLSNGIAAWEYGLEGSLASDRATNAQLYLALGDTYKLEGSYVQAEEIYELGMQRCKQIEDWVGYLRARLGYAETLLQASRVLGGRGEQEGLQTLAEVIRDVDGMLQWIGSPSSGSAGGLKELITMDGIKVQAMLLLSRVLRGMQGASAQLDRLSRSLEYFFQGNQKNFAFESDKELYTDFLHEASLRSYQQGAMAEHQAYELSLERLYEVMSLPYKKALYHLDLAVLMVEKDPKRAGTEFARATQLFTRIRHEVGAAYASEGEAAIHLTQARYAEAEALLRQVLTVYDDHGTSPRNMARAWQMLGNAALLSGQAERAKKYFLKSERRDSGCQDLRIQKFLWKPAFSALLVKWLEEFQKSAFEFVGMSGWNTKKDLGKPGLEI